MRRPKRTRVYFVVYNLETGAILSNQGGRDGYSPNVPDGYGALEVSDGKIAGPDYRVDVDADGGPAIAEADD